MFLKLTHPFL